jgi:hypothetical protein
MRWVEKDVRDGIWDKVVDECYCVTLECPEGRRLRVQVNEEVRLPIGFGMHQAQNALIDELTPLLGVRPRNQAG